MNRDKAAKLKLYARALPAHVGSVASAENRGTVTLDYRGLFVPHAVPGCIKHYARSGHRSRAFVEPVPEGEAGE